MTNKRLSNDVKNKMKRGLNTVLKSNANSTGCYIIYQPKVPKSIKKFKTL